MKKRIIITGATGLIGSQLTKQIADKYDLILLTRSPQKYTSTESVKYVFWDGKSSIPELLENSYAVVNLIGENIGKKKWTNAQKALILNSRKDAALAISESFKQCSKKPQLWLQASATGYYGQIPNIVFNESSPKGKNSFLADVCDTWEKPIKDLDDDAVRKVIIRTGVVLGKKSDLWKELTTSFKFGVAAIPGNGKQHLPWIHIDDEINVIIQALDNENYSGVFNLAAPYEATMQEVIEAIKLKKKNFITINIPAWFLQLIFGKEMTNEIVLTNQHVDPSHLLKMDYTFKYPSIKDAVNNLLSTSKKID